MGAITQQQVMDQLATIDDPDLDKDLVSLNMVKEIRIDGATVQVHIELTTPACPSREKIKSDVEQAIMRIGGVESVNVEFGAAVRSSRPTSSTLPGVKNVIAVGAGKGGVGKSTAAVLLAYGLSRQGASVGLMDADVYGPSIPTLTGLGGAQPEIRKNVMIPPIAGGVKVMSIGFLIEPGKPVIWRGPMIHGVVKQFLEQVEWGELDYLLVDLPPGTGDVPLSLAQTIPVTGAVVICTPQDLALQDARRAVAMYAQLNVECLGIIENMSYYLCPKCGHRDELFDHGGAAAAAKDLEVPFLGEIPLNASIRVFGDGGTPEKMFTECDDFVRRAIDDVVANTAAQISIKAQDFVAAAKLSVE